MARATSQGGALGYIRVTPKLVLHPTTAPETRVLRLKTLDFGFRLEGQVNNDIMQVSSLCVIDQRYSGVDWPLDCQGNLASGSGADCKLDVAMIAQQIIENEAKQQIQDTIEEKAGSFIKKIFGG